VAHAVSQSQISTAESTTGGHVGSVGNLKSNLIQPPQTTTTTTTTTTPSSATATPQLPSYLNNRKQSSSSTSSSSSSSSTSSERYHDEASNSSNNDLCEFDNFDEIADCPNSLILKFKCSLSDEKEVEWKTLLVNGVLYVDIPSSVLPKGSRDSFVSLLEFAEEKLDCQKVYVCFKRNRPDRSSLMRVFMFFGFSVVPPGNPQVPQSDDIMSMVYNIQ
jgi:ornithine decarboxylase antizyme 1